MNTYNVQIVFTYECDSSCKYCILFSDKLSWRDYPVLSKEDLDQANEDLKSRDVTIRRLRLSGGEPTLHPNFRDLEKHVRDSWKYLKIRVCTNKGEDFEKSEGIEYRRSLVSKRKIRRHTPALYSPDDLGFCVSKRKPLTHCRVYRRCGSLFDVFGFGFCIKAGVLGRLLRIDPYSNVPVFGKQLNMDICRHCPYVLSKKERRETDKKIVRGEIEYPTKTFVEGLERDKREPFLFKTYRERKQ